jgi:hypothetical protein
VILKDKVCGEDDPLFSERLEREGWILKQNWEVENRGYPRMFRTLNPEIREKAEPAGRHLIRLIRSIVGLDYSEDFALVDQDGNSTTVLQGASWADWDQRGRFVFARDGKVMVGSFDHSGTMVPRQVADLNPSTPSAVPTPEWAAKW